MFACATAENFQTLMLCRFFAGVFASCPLAVVGGAFSDMFGNETRGIAIACFSALVFIGPFLSPIVGAFITESYLGWRWTQVCLHHSDRKSGIIR
jgi:DHA1 family multidrug resistance protein-like MFS transporter